MTKLTRTKAQLEELGYPFIGIECQDGLKIFGRVTKFTEYKIYLRDKNNDILDVPRRIIRRAFMLIEGGKKEDGTAEVFGKSKSAGGQKEPRKKV